MTKLIIGVFLVLLTGLSDSDKTCHQGCVIKVKKHLIPCSFMEQNLTDCKFNSFSVNSEVVFNVKHKKFLNLTLSVGNRQTEAHLNKLYVDISDSNELNAGCYGISIASKHPLRNQQKKIKVHCIEINKSDKIGMALRSRSDSTTSRRSVKLQFLFNPTDRILKIPKMCKCGKLHCQIYISEQQIKIKVPTLEDIYLQIPPSIDALKYLHLCKPEAGAFNVSELQKFSENLKSHCIFMFPSKLNIKMRYTVVRKKIEVSFRTKLCSDFNVNLFTTPNQDCLDSANIKYEKSICVLQNPAFDYSATFTDLQPGNYCIRISSMDAIYSDAPAFSSAVIFLH